MPGKVSGPRCSVDGCEKLAKQRSWCTMHYGRWYRTGKLTRKSNDTKAYEPVWWFVTHIEIVESGCWLWRGGRRADGYGRIGVNNRSLLAHRWSYEHFMGPIPEGLVLDHLCRVPQCTNPLHLEPVTPRENVLRGYASQPRTPRPLCIRGHPLSGDNLYVDPAGIRGCRACRLVSQATYRAARKARRQLSS